MSSTYTAPKSGVRSSWLLLGTFVTIVSLTTFKTVQAEEVVVTITEGRSALAERSVPGLYTVIGRDEIAESKAQTLAEVLAGQPGIQLTDIYGDGTQTSVDMRGFGATASSNVLILVDGQRLNNSSDIAAPALQRIQPEQIERIEIIRGSAGVLLGNQAVGGVVNIITRSAKLPGAFVEGTVGSYNSIDGKFGVSQDLGAGFFLRLDGDYSDTDNYRDNNDTKLRHLGAQLIKEYEAGAVFAELKAGREDQELPGSLFAEEVKMDRRQSADVYSDDFRKADIFSGRLGLDHQFTDDWQFKGEANWRKEDGEFLVSFRSFPGSEATQDRRLWSFYPRLIGKVHERVDLTLGVDYENTDYRLVTSFGPQEVDQTIWAVYGVADVRIDERWRGSLGLRRTGVENDIAANGEEVDLNDAYTLGTASIEYQPNANWRGFLRADQNIRFATVDEHTNIIFGQPIGISNQPGVSWETGVQWMDNGASVQLTAYQLNLKDEISFNADTFTNTNLDSTRRRGFTLEGSIAPAAGWTVGGQYSFTDGVVTDGPFDGNRIPLVARHTGRVFTRGRFAQDFTLFAEAVYTGQQYLGSDYNNDFRPLDAFTVVNAALTWEKHGWRLGARIDNLLNELYNASGSVGFDESFTRRPAFFPAPERRFNVSARYDF